MRTLSLAAAVPLLFTACLASDSSDDKDESHHVLAYDTLDACAGLDTEEACLADATCTWYALGIPCQEGETCVSGVCQDIDPCRAHTDPDACAADADNRCAWAATELCPADDCGDGGFCYQVPEDDCTCVCPLECPEGGECPPCECDCSGSGGGGGGEECVCTGTACPDGATDCVPDPIECTCGTDEGVVCPDAADAESCEAVEGCGWVPDPCPLCPSPECTCEETSSCQYVGTSSGGGGSSGGGTTTVPPWDQ